MGRRHRYDYKVYPGATSAGGHVVRMVGQNQRVLELGPGPGAITKQLKEHGRCKVTAIELDEAAVAQVAPLCERVYRADLNDAGWTTALSEEKPFSVVVAADVLEHLRDPWQVMRTLREVLDDEGTLIVSLPHAGHSAVVACLLDDDFDYQEYGLLDRTHIRFFGIKNVQSLFDDAGYSIVDAAFVVKRPDRTEFAVRWRRMSADVKRVLSNRRFAEVYQIVVKAKVATRGETGIKLADVPIPGHSSPLGADAGAVQRLMYDTRERIVSHMSIDTRMRVRRALGLFRPRSDVDHTPSKD